MAATLAVDPAVVTDDARDVAVWASALLVALARDETAGRRAQRVTEPGLGTWARFRGRLTATDFLDLLFEDAAVLHHIPFDPALLDTALRLDRLSAGAAEALLKALPSVDLKSAGPDYVGEQAHLLGLTTRLARSELHVVKPHQKVLELPGTGGQLAHHLVSTQKDLTFQDNFTVACSTWQELTLAGLVALERGAPNSDFAVKVDVDDLRDSKHALRQRSFDFVIGLHPDKGGQFRIEDQLAIWFPNARVLLV
jgi:hypothetical protein